ncbi:NFkB inhibitor [Cotia virus SPAn232]|uniref:NFkB inhibitor n=2 Tax=Cotia virus TaxID=39444 RepID=H6TAD4_9POXV|nr:NFkB inhibitor [Cotia virus SPAn232]AFB76968.1 NFkB inhibitor [Cotia virus SPAn232]AIT70781.1 NFkB inhibitor [Cotia virus]
MATFSTNYCFSPPHCQCNKLTDVDEIKQCLIDYLYWSSYAFRNRECAGQVYVKLISFRDDSTSVFGDFKNMVRNMPFDNVEDCVEIIRCYIPDNVKTTREVSAIVGLCAYAATYWGGETFPTSESINALFVMVSLLDDSDYIKLFNSINN